MSEAQNKTLRDCSFRLFILALFFLITHPIDVFADPVSGITATILIGLAVSAATTAAQFILQKVLTPKPKPVDKNKLQGEVQLSTTGEDIFINEIYGCRQTDGQGAMKVGGVFFYASPIRLQVVTVSGNGGGGNSGGKGGFGGGGSAPAQREHHYYQDFAIMFGRGPCRILEIKVGTDVVYKNYPRPLVPIGDEYEAEDAILSGTAPNADSGFSGGFNVPMDANDTATFTIEGDGASHAFYIYYYCIYDNCYLNVTINGEARRIATPNTYGRIETVMIAGSTNDGDTTVFIHAPAGQSDTVWLDKIAVAEAFVETIEPTLSPISGIRDPEYVNPIADYDFSTLRDPLAGDYRAADEYNYQPNANSTGETSATLPAGAEIRIYEGNFTQNADPLIEAYYSQMGITQAPAMRGRCYAMFQNFETTKYGGVTPQITAVIEHLEIHDLGAMYKHRAKRVGLKDEGIDFEALTDVPLRGFAITSRQPPRTEMEILNRIFDVDVVEKSDGKIYGIVPSENIIATIPFADLEAEEEGNKQTKRTPYEEIIRDDYQIPRRLDISFFRSDKDWDVGSVQARRTVTVSEEVENIESALVLTEAEAQKIADRELQKLWAEKDAFGFATFYKHGYLEPADLIAVETHEGSQLVRVKAINGNIPGKLKFTCVARNLPEPAERVFQVTHTDPLAPVVPNIPGHCIGTIIDVAVLRTTETVPGYYIVAAMTDDKYEWKGASLWWEREAGYELLEILNYEGTIGRTIDAAGGVLADVPGGWSEGAWDTISQVTFDLFNGIVESKNSDAEVLDRAAALLIGDEIVPFRYATRVNGYPNRWTVSRLQRRAKGTYSNSHSAGERVVLLNEGVKFVPLDISEFGKTRNYKYVAAGQEVSSASSFSFTWDGNTNQDAIETLTPEIEKVGLSTLEKVTLGVKGYSERMRYRKIETANNSDFSTGYAVTVKDYQDVVNNNNAALEVIPYTDNPTKYVQVSHSRNNSDYSPVSNTLQIQFYNENEDGVPVLQTDNAPSVALVETNWIFKLKDPLKNGYAPRSVIIRMLNIDQGREVAGSYSETDNTFNLNTASGLPSDGRVYNANTGETISYTGIAGDSLTGCTRGVDGSIPAVMSNGDAIVPITIQYDLRDTLVFPLPQMVDTHLLQYRWRNVRGYSDWSLGGMAYGSGSVTQPPPPTPPPAVEPAPEPGYEDPLDPENDKRYPGNIITV